MTENQKMVIWGAGKNWKSSSPVGSHGYAKEFIKHGWKVAFLSTNITPWHQLFSRDRQLLDERCSIHNHGGIWHEENNLWEYVPWSLVHSKWLPSSWMRFGFGDLDKAMRQSGITCLPDIVWVDSPEYGCLFDRYPHAKHIIRIADKNQYFKGATKQLLKRQIQYTQKADLVVVTSFALEEEYKQFGIRNIIRVPNGVDLNRFHIGEKLDLPEDIKHISTPIALYVGMIEEWFDLELLKSVAIKLPGINFVIIGKVGISIETVKSVSNVHFLGPRSPELVAAYMKSSEVGIIPFLQNDFVDAINPVKYYEYIACGLPVVATHSREFRLLGEPVFLAKNSEDFAHSIQAALNIPLDARELLERRAWNASWETRWKTILSFLER